MPSYVLKNSYRINHIDNFRKEKQPADIGHLKFTKILNSKLIVTHLQIYVVILLARGDPWKCQLVDKLDHNAIKQR